MIGQTISHYRITAELGKGGMGTVYRADDLKLDRTVALKFLAPEFLRDPDAKARFVHEAKAASALDHPNICTIHAIEETTDGRLFITMACYEGETLKDRIARGPLPVDEAVEITVQVAQGLAKAHGLGIVHRDIKPANVMVTEDGLVKLLDFGIAKLTGETQLTHAGTAVGTVHYMSPEQIRGGQVDRRSDVWSLGVLLYEMLAGRPPFTGESPETVLYALVHTEPAPLAEHRGDVPPELQHAVASCLAKAPSERLDGMGALLQALRPLTAGGNSLPTLRRTAGQHTTAEARGLRPYPGLSSFSEADAEFFHGRESQVESVWQQLRHDRLLAVAGPSGVGKTSFLRAGLIPARPRRWGILVATPGGSPFLSLREALARELSGDTETIVSLLREDDPDTDVATFRRWRQRHDEALVILDQFEELFTLSPPAEQTRFADLISRLVFEADVRVLVSLRDDFLFHCQEHPGLAPVLHALTMLTPLSGSTLRRAVMQPALDCGYRFEDPALVDEILAAVEGERGALPLLAFAMARLWEHRDRDEGLLTREAYREIGEVGGALARHAEAVMDRIGEVRRPLVRELFRNLVTAQGTRAVLDREQLLSVFPGEEQAAADEVLNELIDARLLTSFEVKGEDGRQHHRVEIVHESLLKAWPRLVRWQTQDADGAQLRDQLRQAAQLWEQKGQTDDLLWTGTAYQEFALWRERYPGGLSDNEEAFAGAMTARATARRRRRRLTYASSVVALLAVLLVVGGLWRQARREAGISEARGLQIQAEQALEEDNTLALALATACLEREDSPEMRRLALRALWKGPVRRVLESPYGQTTFPAISPDGRWIAAAVGDSVVLWPNDGGAPRTFTGRELEGSWSVSRLEFDATGETLFGYVSPVDLADFQGEEWSWVWSIPDGQLLHAQRHVVPPMLPKTFYRGDPPRLIMALKDDANHCWSWRRYELGREKPELLGRADASFEYGEIRTLGVDPSGHYLLDHKGQDLFLFGLDSLASGPVLRVGSHPHQIYTYYADWEHRRVASSDLEGGVRIWSLDAPGEPIALVSGNLGKCYPRLGPSGERLVFMSQFRGGQFISVLDLTRPGAERLRIWPQSEGGWGQSGCTPDGQWVVGRHEQRPEIWLIHLGRPFPTSWRAHPDSLLSAAGRPLWPMATTADGEWLIFQREFTELWRCRLRSARPESRLLLRHPTPAALYFPKADPRGRYILACENIAGHAWLIPLDGGEPRTLGEFTAAPQAIAFSGDGQTAIVGGYVLRGQSTVSAICFWNLDSGEESVLLTEHGHQITDLIPLPEGKLLEASTGGLRVWDLETERREVLSEGAYVLGGKLDASTRFLAIGTPGQAEVWDLETGTCRPLPLSMDANVFPLDIAPDASFVVAGRDDGDVICHSLETGETHRLFGHDDSVTFVEIIDDGERIMTASFDGTVRVWEVPRGRSIDTLPIDELLAYLHAQTNLRIVPDVNADDGYRITYGPFSGWAKPPPIWLEEQASP